MERNNLIVKKDFGNLVKGDEIEISTDCDSRVYFSVLNRKRIVRFYGNEKGRWGAGNPIPRTKDFVPFILQEEKMPRFTAMTFDKLPQQLPHPSKELQYADGTENWQQKCIDKIIEDFKAIGVL